MANEKKYESFKTQKYDAAYYHGYKHENEYDNIFIDKQAMDEIAVTGINYIFFTVPHLGLTLDSFKSIKNSNLKPEICFENNRNVLKLPGEVSITGSTPAGDSIYSDDLVETLSGGKPPFMNILTNRAASIPASTETLNTLDYTETWNRYKIPLGTSTKDSKISGNFEILYKEDADLTMFKLHKLWIDYIEGVFMGRLISPHATHTDMGATQNMYIDYMSSAYVFSLKPDGKTIQYWAKYTGVFPTKNPYEIFASEDGAIEGITKMSMDYQFAYKEDMDITILRDFNLITDSQTPNLINAGDGKYFDENTVTVGTSSGYPRVNKVKNEQFNTVEYVLLLQDTSNKNGQNTNY